MCKCKQDVPLKLEVGKTYLNRRGEEVKVVEEDTRCGDKFKFYDNSEPVRRSYTKEGNYLNNNISACDLIKEYKPKYITVEGHEIVRDGVYETRNGKRVDILGFYNFHNIVGTVEEDTYIKTQLKHLLHWSGTGIETNCHSKWDIMRPWVDKKPTDIIEKGTYTKQRNHCINLIPERF